MHVVVVLLVVSLLSVFLSACGSRSSGDGSTNFVDQKGRGQDPDKSDLLADDGEALLETAKLNDAFAKFNLALELNPDNRRAAFWRAMLHPMLELKGINRRVAPLYRQLEDGDARYGLSVQMMPTHHQDFRAYLSDGPEDILTYQDLQEWLDRFRNSLITLREELRAIRDSEITINLPGYIITGAASNDDCRPLKFGPIQVEALSQGCANRGKRAVGVNRADIEVLILAASAYQAYTEMWNAYRIDPIAAAKISKGMPRSRESAEAKLKALLDFTGGGALRNPKGLSGLRDVSAEMVAGMKYILDNQREACPQGWTNPKNRKGYLIASGMCIEYDINSEKGTTQNHTLNTLRMFEAIVGGKPVDIYHENKVVARFRALEFFERPPGNLKDLAPFTFDQCGNLMAVNTSVVNSYLTEGTIDDIMANRRRTNREDCQREYRP